MRKIDLLHHLRLLLAALVLVGGASSRVWADDLFSLAPALHDNLIIFGPKGEQVAELSVPTISQAITVGGTSFQISYGRDANSLLTAILAPSSGQPQKLHFTVLHKTIEADKDAVVTLTFPDTNHVIVDPGYIGVVAVDSRVLHQRSIADETPLPPPPVRVYSQPTVTRTVASAQLEAVSPSNPPPPQESPNQAVRPFLAPISHETAAAPVTAMLSAPPATVPAPVRQSPPPPPPQPKPQPQPVTVLSEAYPAQSMAPAPMTPPPLLGSLISQPPIQNPGAGSSSGVSGTNPSAPPPAPPKLYWSEPITSPNGATPSVAIDEMRLVAVHGPVTLKLPNGDTKNGSEGMLVPSGTSITTAENASAAVFIGGVDSARLTSNTEAKVTENIDGSTRHTTIKLKNGTVFNRVGHRPGEKQDYVVHTPEGTAAARGTSFAVGVVDSNGHEVTVCVTQEGVVTLTDSADGHQITITPQSGAQIAIGSVPPLPDGLLQAVVIAFMVDLQQFDTTIEMIANMNPKDRTPAEEAYYEANKGFDQYTKAYMTNTGDLISLLTATTADSTLYINQMNGINYVVPPARRANNQMLRPYGTQPLSPF